MTLRPAERYQAFVICTSPRSGSTLLCKLLASTGQAGHPGSYFHNADVEDWRKSLGIAEAQFASEAERLRAVIAAAREAGTAGTGIFGLRLQRKSFDFFFRQLEVLHPALNAHSERFQAEFGKTLFIHLTRSDKIAQAVSFVKASQTGLWHKAPDGTELERLAPPSDPAYDAGLIREHVDQMTAYEQGWMDWFQAENIMPFRISYDDLSEDPETVIAAVLEQLGRDPVFAGDMALPVARLSDGINQEWIERFLREDLIGQGSATQN